MGADDRCTNFASLGGLGGTWRAFAGSSTSGGITASSRVVANGPWYQQTTSGALVLTFNNRANLATAPLVQINVDENGAALPPGTTLVWTGTASGGAIANACTTWTAGATTGTIGTYGRVGAGASLADWTGYATQDCSATASLICLEESRSPPPPPLGPTKRMFVTSVGTNGALGGTAGADARCGTVAAAAGKTGNFKAYVGSSTSGGITAISRIVSDGSWYQDRSSGLVLTFRNKAQLLAAPLVNIDTIETGAQISGPMRVWTGTTMSGAIGNACTTWSAGATSGTNGTYGIVGTSAARSAWTGAGTQDCTSIAGLICLED
jgi:hypothetical protein